MPNEIRRSETRKDSYDRLAEALGLTAAKGPGPKFGEDGKAATYHERDADQLPAFTSNLITISQTTAPKEPPKTASSQSTMQRLSQNTLHREDDAELESLFDEIQKSPHTRLPNNAYDAKRWEPLHIRRHELEETRKKERQGQPLESPDLSSDASGTSAECPDCGFKGVGDIGGLCPLCGSEDLKYKPDLRMQEFRTAQRSLHRITSAEEQERELAVRSAMRHVLAGDDLEVEARNPWVSRKKEDYDSKGPGHVVDQDSVVDHSSRPNKRCRGKSGSGEQCKAGCQAGSDYCSQHAKQASSSSQREVIASITALAPEARIRRDGTFNVIVASTVANLVRGLDIPEAKSEWLAAQAETGLRDDSTFVRDVRAAVEGNRRLAQMPEMRETFRGLDDAATDMSGVHLQPGMARDIDSGPRRNLRRKEAVVPEWAMALGEKLFGGYPEVRAAVKAGDPSIVMEVAKGKFPGLADDQLLQVTHAVSALAKKLGRAKEQAKAEMAPAEMGSEEVM